MYDTHVKPQCRVMGKVQEYILLTFRTLAASLGNTQSLGTVTVPTTTPNEHKSGQTYQKDNPNCHREHAGCSRKGRTLVGLYICPRVKAVTAAVHTHTIRKTLTWMEPSSRASRSRVATRQCAHFMRSCSAEHHTWECGTKVQRRVIGSSRE